MRLPFDTRVRCLWFYEPPAAFADPARRHKKKVG